MASRRCTAKSGKMAYMSEIDNIEKKILASQNGEIAIAAARALTLYEKSNGVKRTQRMKSATARFVMRKLNGLRIEISAKYEWMITKLATVPTTIASI